MLFPMVSNLYVLLWSKPDNNGLFPWYVLELVDKCQLVYTLFQKVMSLGVFGVFWWFWALWVPTLGVLDDGVEFFCVACLKTRQPQPFSSVCKWACVKVWDWVCDFSNRYSSSSFQSFFAFDGGNEFSRQFPFRRTPSFLSNSASLRSYVLSKFADSSLLCSSDFGHCFWPSPWSLGPCRMLLMASTVNKPDSF